MTYGLGKICIYKTYNIYFKDEPVNHITAIRGFETLRAALAYARKAKDEIFEEEYKVRLILRLHWLRNNWWLWGKQR